MEMEAPVPKRMCLKRMSPEEKAAHKAAQVRARMKRYYERHRDEIIQRRKAAAQSRQQEVETGSITA